MAGAILRAGLREPPVKRTPVSSAMRRESPMHIGAMNVALCFSAASMKMVKTNPAVKDISMKRPWTTDVPAPRFVVTVRGPGNRHETTAAAEMAPHSWAKNKSSPLKYVTAPTRHIPSVTAGLNVPPLILKNTRALTASENPKHSAMNSTLFVVEEEVVVAPLPVVLATWVPERAKNRKRNVPTNSPAVATMWAREPWGKMWRRGIRLDFMLWGRPPLEGYIVHGKY